MAKTASVQQNKGMEVDAIAVPNPALRVTEYDEDTQGNPTIEITDKEKQYYFLTRFPYGWKVTYISRGGNNDPMLSSKLISLAERFEKTGKLNLKARHKNPATDIVAEYNNARNGDWYAEKTKSQKGSPDWHQERILLSNFKLVPFMRSHSLAETRKILKEKFGYSDTRIAALDKKNDTTNENPQRSRQSSDKRLLVTLARRIREFTYGLPDDQLTEREERLVKKYPMYFENDNGYIKVKRAVTNPRAPNVHWATPFNASGQTIRVGWIGNLQVANVIQEGSGKYRVYIRGTRGRVELGNGFKELERAKEIAEKHFVKENPQALENPYIGGITETLAARIIKAKLRGDVPAWGRMNVRTRTQSLHALKDNGLLDNFGHVTQKGQDWLNDYQSKRNPETVQNSEWDTRLTPNEYDARQLRRFFKYIEKGEYQKAQDFYLSYRRVIGKNAREQMAKTVHQYLKTNRNHSKGDFNNHVSNTIADISQMFQGQKTGSKEKLLAPESMPNKVARLGNLVQMKYRNGAGNTDTIDFDGQSYLVADHRKNLWAIGKDAVVGNVKRARNGMIRLGELFQIDYITAKKHIENGQTIRFWHRLGEVNKQNPELYIDSDGFPIIVGGGYDVWEVGIVN